MDALPAELAHLDGQVELYTEKLWLQMWHAIEKLECVIIQTNDSVSLDEALKLARATAESETCEQISELRELTLSCDCTALDHEEFFGLDIFPIECRLIC